MKNNFKIISIVCLLLMVGFNAFADNSRDVTFTSQSALDSYTFASDTSYFVKLENDTNLPISDQIHDLTHLNTIDTIMSLRLSFTKVQNFDNIDCSHMVTLELEGNSKMDSLIFNSTFTKLNNVNFTTTHLQYIGGNIMSNSFWGFYLESNMNLKTVDITLPLANLTTPTNGAFIHVQFNDSLVDFSYDNPFPVINKIKFYDNRLLKHIHIEKTANFVTGESGFTGIVFNPELDSISGFAGLDSMGWIGIMDNSNLNDACVFQGAINNTLQDYPNWESKINISNNGGALESLQDLFDADCSYLPNSVQEALFDDISMYPNPTSNKLFIDVKKETAYTIYSSSGSLMKSGTLAVGSSIDVSAFSSGLYIISIENKWGRFIKQR